MKIKMDKLYGIRNKVEIEFKNNLILFAPNGTGKSSLARGFKNIDSDSVIPNIEGDTDRESLIISDDGIKIKSATIIDDEFLDQAFKDKDSIIRMYLKKNPSKEGDLPSNLSGDYFDIYSDVIQEIKDIGIDPSPFEVIFDMKSLDSVYEVNEQLKSIHEENFSDDKFQGLKRTRIELIEILETLKEKRVLNFREMDKKIKEAVKPAVSDELKTDYELLNIIKEKDRQIKFKYEVNGDFISSKVAFDDIEKIIKEAGVSKSEFKEYQAYSKANIILNKTINKTSSVQIRGIKEKLDVVCKQIYLNSLKKKEDLFRSHIENMEINIENFIKKYNMYIKEINKNLLKNNNLRWSVELKEIDSFDEPVSFKIFQDDAERTSLEFIDFASSGQKRIISLILAIAFSSNSSLVVFDDPITSMDSDNSEIFVNALNNLQHKCIILTHSYSFAAKFGFNDEFKFEIMDSNNNGEVITVDANSRSLIFLNSWLKEDVSIHNEPGKIILLSSVLREMIGSYLSRYSSNILEEELTDSAKIRNSIDKLFRHYKFTDFTFSEAMQELKEGISNDHLKIYSEELGVFDKFFSYESNVKVTEYVKEYNHKQMEFKSLLDYVVHKYMLALSSRFLIEEYIVSKERAATGWDRGDYMGISKLANGGYGDLIKLNLMLNYLNHVNNLRWTPIVETPIHKLHIYRNLIKAFK